MSKKLTTEDFILKARQVHGWKYDYSNVNYVDSKMKVCIICPIHGEFWQTPSNHISGGQGCPLCAKKHRIISNTKKVDLFINDAIKVHGDKYDYSKLNYVNNHTKVCIICKEHGEFFQKPNSHLNGSGCPICGREIAAFKHNKTTDWFIKKAIETHGNKYDYRKTEYINMKQKIRITCPFHGDFWQKPSDHLRGLGCAACSGNKKSNKEEFVKKSKEIHGDKYIYDYVFYVNANINVNIMCKKHGIFNQSPHNHLKGAGCPKCSSSHGELKINDYLKQNNIEYKTQHPVKLEQRMFARNNLKIDFYLPNYNTFIEFNGIQHYEFTPAFYKTEEDFNKQVERDKRLKDYCKKNKIKLIVIKYNQINKIEEILNKKLKIN